MPWHNTGDWEGLSVGNTGHILFSELFLAVQERHDIQGDGETVDPDYLLPETWDGLSNENIIHRATDIIGEVIRMLNNGFESGFSGTTFANPDTGVPWYDINDVLEFINSPARTDKTTIADLPDYADFDPPLPLYRGCNIAGEELITQNIFILLKELLNALTHVYFIYYPTPVGALKDDTVATGGGPVLPMHIQGGYTNALSDSTPTISADVSAGFTISNRTTPNVTISLNTDVYGTVDLPSEWPQLLNSIFVNGTLEFYSTSQGADGLSMDFNYEIDGVIEYVKSFDDTAYTDTLDFSFPLTEEMVPLDDTVTDFVLIRTLWTYPPPFVDVFGDGGNGFRAFALMKLTFDTSPILEYI